MKKNKYLISLLIPAVFIGLAISGCSGDTADAGEEKIIIITTIVTIGDLAERIAGEKASVMSLIPPGASPHSFEPTPGDLEMAAKARMFAKVGSGIEFELEWTDKIIGMNRDISVVDCSRGITLISSDDEDKNGYDHQDYGADPHIWLSPVNAKIISQNIFEGLIEVDPENKEYYKGNLEEFLVELDDLDYRIREILSGRGNRKILVFHPAWTYFTQEYGLEQIVVQMEGKEPTLKSMESLIRQAMDEGIKIIFASPEFDTKSAEVISAEIGGEVILISPLPQDYISDLEKIARAFEESMVK